MVQDGHMNVDGTLAVVVHDEDKNASDRWDEFYDDISGLPLSSEGVRAARKEEMRIFGTFPVYTKVRINEAWSVTGKGPIGTRWLDINKGDEDSPELRSRLVGQEFNRSRDDLMFAATPPLELKKALFSLAVTGTKDSKKPLKLLFIDVRRAYFYAKARRPVYVKLPPEDHEEGKCGRLNVSLYGTRDAASNWEATYTEGLVADGWSPGAASPCCFHHGEKNLSFVGHGDDFTFLGDDDALDWVEQTMRAKYKIKVRGRLGPEKHDDKSIRILNRIVTWDREGILYEADQRHAEILVR